MPSICQNPPRQCQDSLMFLLFSFASEKLLRQLVCESMNNVLEDFHTPGVRAALEAFAPKRETSLAHLKLYFCMLLNVDERMRRRLCSSQIDWSLQRVCPNKACVFYDQLRETLMPAWLKDETVSLLDMNERLKDAYLVS
jgi:hypothetical protein